MMERITKEISLKKTEFKDGIAAKRIMMREKMKMS